MKFEIIPTPDFEKSFKALAKRHRSLKQDFREFSEELKQNPYQGDELTPGVRKIRMAITSKGRGKSGGARDCKNKKNSTGSTSAGEGIAHFNSLMR